MAKRLVLAAAVMGVFAWGDTARAGDVVVGSVGELVGAIQRAGAGDRIVVKDGTYSFEKEVVIDRAGTAAGAISIEAQTVGGVTIEGEAGFHVAKSAAYLVIKGFDFRHKAGAMVVEAGAHHIRITRNVFALKVTGRSTYLTVSGDDVEVDHNTFRDKSTEGQMLFVQGPGNDGMAQRTWVHHNLFTDFKNTHANNASGLHIGSSGRSMTSAHSVVEYNLFVRNVGENEGAICNKSCDNIYRYNTIVDSTELSLRHGHRCQVYGNFILNSEGVRFFAWDHEIYSNYFEGCHPAITIGNGDATIPPGKLTAHQRPDRVKVVYNTLVNNRINVQMTGRKGGLGAEDLVFADNLIVGGNEAVRIAGPMKGAKWEGNLVWDAKGGDMPEGGYTVGDPKMGKDEKGVWRISAGGAASGKGVGAYPFVKVDMDGQEREAGRMDVGADQVSDSAVVNGKLGEGDVGTGAAEWPVGRGVFGEARGEWIEGGK